MNNLNKIYLDQIISNYKSVKFERIFSVTMLLFLIAMIPYITMGITGLKIVKLSFWENIINSTEYSFVCWVLMYLIFRFVELPKFITERNKLLECSLKKANESDNLVAVFDSDNSIILAEVDKYSVLNKFIDSKYNGVNQVELITSNELDNFNIGWKNNVMSIYILEESGIKVHFNDQLKDPITDISKRSPKGRISTFVNHKDEVFYERVDLIKFNQELRDVMEVVYLNGEIVREYSFDEIINGDLVHFKV